MRSVPLGLGCKIAKDEKCSCIYKILKWKYGHLDVKPAIVFCFDLIKQEAVVVSAMSWIMYTNSNVWKPQATLC